MIVLDRIRKALGFRPASLPADQEDPFEDELQLPDGLPDQIHTVEQAALAIYRRHNLPTDPVSYLKRGPDAPWEVLPAGLTPADKWNMVNAAPAGAGWRFGDRSILGRQSPHEEVRNASTLLATCDQLRRKLSGESPVTAQDIADAMLLGTAAGVLMSGASQVATAEPHAPLSFYAVEDEAED
ncbi:MULTISPECIES: hypothetical protein [unclassified Brevundimonas]|uniref:hypothetical protein n=1 Tax=unclassified Brevundimonas TaxID=2622653 RepID=UPI0025BFE851|nr:MULTISPECIES: hypothetical protein [unclassified Brevundimonas]